MKEIVVGITDCGSYANYEKWMLNVPGVTTIRLSYKEGNPNDINKCHGVILSGGEDVHPRFYNKKEYIEYCDDIDERRDEFEWNVLEYTEPNNVPLLGICRGLQMANVFFGGTLIPDLPSFGKYNHSKFPKQDRYHDIDVDPDSFLSKITGQTSGEINSAHHQSADMIGKGLVVNSFSPEGTVEGIERRNPEGRGFLMLVQWHPERMLPQQNPFAEMIRSGFIEAVVQSRS